MLDRLGRYEVLGPIGQGAMGAVYRGRDPALDREVALKIISCQTDSDELTARFRREAQAIARLSHPNIVAIYEFGETGSGEPFIAMELLHGETLQQAATKLSLGSKVIITAQVCDALSHAHSRGIIHRDIKPANILLTETGSAKVTDFGIARLATGTLTQSGALFGTPQFMSPEQITGQGIDQRSDIFAVGTLLYWLIAGEHPFAGESIPEVLHKVLSQQPVPLAKSGPAYGALQAILDRALMKNPAERYSDAAEMARDLIGVRRLLEPAAEDWPAPLASSTPLRVAGLPPGEPTELLPGRVFPAAALLKPVAASPAPSPAPKDVRTWHAPAPIVASSGGGNAATPRVEGVRTADALSTGAGAWTRRKIQLQALTLTSIVVVGASLWLFAGSASSSRTKAPVNRAPDTTPAVNAPLPAPPAVSAPPPSSEPSSSPPDAAPRTVRLVVEGPAELLGSVRSLFSSRFQELGLQQVVSGAPAHLELRVTVQASSVEEPVFETKVLRNQAIVTLHASDLLRRRVLDRDSGVVTNSVQDSALGKAEAVKAAVTRVLPDADILQHLTGPRERQEKP